MVSPWARLLVDILLVDILLVDILLVDVVDVRRARASQRLPRVRH